MRLQEIIFLVLTIGGTCSMQAQSKTTYPSQKGKHTLSFYPLHRSYDHHRYAREDYIILPAIGYNYHIKEDWTLQGKLFYRQVGESFFNLIQRKVTEKNIKLGLQYYCVNKSLQIQLGLYTYLERRNITDYQAFDLTGEGLGRISISEKEIGVEFSLGFGWRITDQARLTFTSALRYGEYKKDKLIGVSYSGWQDNLIESFGFGYTF